MSAVLVRGSRATLVDVHIALGDYATLCEIHHRAS